eukprot:Unigene3637_Nuclearia_a/m.11099 Unigene3637_Nuclearia_a/g.11099  ORF Unigene3637_Nuclearia_a/g.11099 Unigene3637_Nuclearia_a/m.11099 type:complete len:252 (-) Unigene3637_Nuclearia_a:33-788(-)
MPGVSTITGNPVLLIGFFLAFAGWVIALAGVSQISALGPQFAAAYAFTWWTIVYVLLVLAVLVYTIIQGTFAQYRTALGLYVTLATGLLTSATASAPSGAFGALLAGLIILDLVFYPLMGLVIMLDLGDGNGGGMMLPGINITLPARKPSTPQQAPLPGTPAGAEAAAQSARASRTSTAILEEASTEPMPATALFSYTANPNDPNEISFAKGEVLTVLDRKGKWWRAKKADGTVGIVPSNYMELRPTTGNI